MDNIKLLREKVEQTTSLLFFLPVLSFQLLSFVNLSKTNQLFYRNIRLYRRNLFSLPSNLILYI